MSCARFNVTYDLVTPESVECGDLADYGFIGACGLQFSVSGICGKPAGDLKASGAMRLREALAYVSPQYDAGRWFGEVDGRQDYRTGEVETRALHPPAKITAASYGRLSRLLGVGQ